MKIIMLNNNYFVSQRDEDFLVFSKKTCTFVVFSEFEYLMFEWFVGDNSDNVRTKADLAFVFSERLQIPFDICLNKINAFEENIIAKGILCSGENDSYDTKKTACMEKSFNPVAMYLHLTNKCNLKCKYCYNFSYRDKKNTNKEEELSDSEIFNVIDQAIELGVTSFTVTGGEPLLRSSCLDIGSYITKNCKCYAELLTNGVLVEQTDKDKLFSSFSKIVVSLDSFVMEKNDLMRGPGTCKMILKGLDSISKDYLSRVVLRPVLHKINVRDFASYVLQAKERLGITEVKATMYCPVEGISYEEYCMDQEDYLMLLQTNQRLAEKSTFQLENERLFINKGCGAGSNVISVSACGEVFPCQAINSEDMSAGNVRHSSLRDICENSPVMKMFRCHSSRQIEGCNKCSIVSICGGGCRANAYSATGSINKKNESMCHFNQKKIEFLLWQEYDRVKANKLASALP